MNGVFILYLSSQKSNYFCPRYFDFVAKNLVSLRTFQSAEMRLLSESSFLIWFDLTALEMATTTTTTESGSDRRMTLRQKSYPKNRDVIKSLRQKSSNWSRCSKNFWLTALSKIFFSKTKIHQLVFKLPMAF